MQAYFKYFGENQGRLCISGWLSGKAIQRRVSLKVEVPLRVENYFPKLAKMIFKMASNFNIPLYF